MILDKIENSNLYIKTNNNLKKAFEFLENANIEKLADGRYEIESDDIYAFVQSYTTKNSDDNKWESHKKYLDIQYIVSGSETIFWSPIEELVVNEEYNIERDVTFYKHKSNCTELKLSEKHFCMFFPEDGHKPCCIFDTAVQIKKIVVKIKI